MAYCLKITKKGDARYAQIVETFYDPAAKRSTSRSIESFGDINKHLLRDPDFEEKLRQRIVMLNQDDTHLTQIKLEMQLAEQDRKLEQSLHSKLSETYGLNPLNYGLALERALWEEFDLRLLLNRIASNCLNPFPYNLDLIAFFLTELKFNPLGLPARPLAFKDQTIINFSEVSAQEFVEGLLFVAKRKNTILRQIRQKMVMFDKEAQKIEKIQSTQNRKAIAVIQPEDLAHANDFVQDKNISSSNGAINESTLGTIITKSNQESKADILTKSKEASAIQNNGDVASKNVDIITTKSNGQAVTKTSGNITQDKAALFSSTLDWNSVTVTFPESEAVVTADNLALNNIQSPASEGLANMDSIRPFIGKLGFCDIRSIYAQTSSTPVKRQQMIIASVISEDGIPLDFDYLYAGRINYYRPAANLRSLTERLNELCTTFGWTQIIIRVDHTYTINQLILALKDLQCDYLLCISAEFLPKSIRNQFLSAKNWLSLKKETSQAATTDLNHFTSDFDSLASDFDHLVNEVEYPVSDELSEFNAFARSSSGNVPYSGLNHAPCSELNSASPLESQTSHTSTSDTTSRYADSLHFQANTNTYGEHAEDNAKHTAPYAEHTKTDRSANLGIDSNINLAQATVQALKQHRHNALQKSQYIQSIETMQNAPDYKYQQFNLLLPDQSIQLAAVALWSQKRTHAENHMWALSQTIHSQYTNIAGSKVRRAIEQRSDEFLELLGNYNASAPTDFDMLSQLEKSQNDGEHLTDAEVSLMQQIKSNFLSGTIFFVSSQHFTPDEATSVIANLSEWECITLQFYNKILTPWDWTLLQQIAKPSYVLPDMSFEHFHGEIAVSFLAWQLEQWRSFRLHNLNIKASAQDLQKSIDLLSVVRWNLADKNYWLKVNVESLKQTDLSWMDIERIFAHFNLVLPGVPENDESLTRKLKLKLPLQPKNSAKALA